jgi:hypothetical protein
MALVIMKLTSSKTTTRLRSAIYRPVPMAANAIEKLVGESAAERNGGTQKVGITPMRTTEKEITFTQMFQLEALVEPQQAGTYRLIVDEELIEGLSFPAYKRVATHLEIPAIAIPTGKRQLLQVSYDDIYRALALDAQMARSADPG